MSSWKTIETEDSSRPCWKAVLTGADGREAGHFTVDARFGDELLRFMQGVLCVMNAPVAFLTAYDAHGDRFPLRAPVIADSRANDSGGEGSSLAYMRSMFNGFATSGRWTPAFEDLAGNRWTVEFSAVDNAPDAALQESTPVVPAVRGASRPKFRKSFLGGS